MKDFLRVAFFPDSFLEVNGVALTSRRLAEFAEKTGRPFLCVHAGEKTEVSSGENYTDVALKRSPLSFSLDTELKYDPFFNRHIGRVRREIEKFQPDVIHITGLNDVSIIGAWLAYKLHIPLVGSWHTNLHEFAATRLDKMFRFLPGNFRRFLTNFAERKILEGAVLYYKMPKVNLAPNEELIKILSEGTGRTTLFMARGVDSEFYSPEKRAARDSVFRLGFVGRLRAEKNVRLLARLEEKFIEAGQTNYKFLIVGDGNEREWLEKNLKRAEFTGYITGERLARAYADMDLFLFPSETDTYGNVIQEANASGVPAIVSDKGGPKFIVRHDETGFVAKNADEFASYSLKLLNDAEKLAAMKRAAREFARSRSWNSVFESVYEAYWTAIKIAERKKSKILVEVK